MLGMKIQRTVNSETFIFVAGGAILGALAGWIAPISASYFGATIIIPLAFIVGISNLTSP